jgi:hypothetical protein
MQNGIIDKVVLLIVTVALLVAVSQWGMKRFTERVQQMLVTAAEVK